MSDVYLHVTEQKIAYDNTKLWSKFDSPLACWVNHICFLFFSFLKNIIHTMLSISQSG